MDLYVKKTISIKNMDNLPSYHPTQKATTQDAEIYFKAILDMGHNSSGKGIQNAISVKNQVFMLQ